MNKKSYIDPITDYLLHDPEQISDAGAAGRGALTAGGAAGAGYGAYKGADALNTLLQRLGKGSLGGKGKLAAVLGAIGLGGGLGHLAGDKAFAYNYTDAEKIQKKLDAIVAKLNSSNNIALQTAQNTAQGQSIPLNKLPEKVTELSGQDQSLWNKLTSLVRPKSNYEKFKDSGAALWDNLKETGVHGWKALKEELS